MPPVSKNEIFHTLPDQGTTCNSSKVSKDTKFKSKHLSQDAMVSEVDVLTLTLSSEFRMRVNRDTQPMQQTALAATADTHTS